MYNLHMQPSEINNLPIPEKDAYIGMYKELKKAEAEILMAKKSGTTNVVNNSPKTYVRHRK